MHQLKQQQEQEKQLQAANAKGNMIMNATLIEMFFILHLVSSFHALIRCSAQKASVCLF